MSLSAISDARRGPDCAILRLRAPPSERYQVQQELAESRSAPFGKELEALEALRRLSPLLKNLRGDLQAVSHRNCSMSARRHAIGARAVRRWKLAGRTCELGSLLGAWSRLSSSTGAFFVYFQLRHRPGEHDAPPGQLGLHQLHHT